LIAIGIAIGIAIEWGLLAGFSIPIAIAIAIATEKASGENSRMRKHPSPFTSFTARGRGGFINHP
jgi:hypothetical protein